MTKTTIAGGVAAIVFTVLALAAGYRALEKDVDSTAATSPAITPSTAATAEAHPSFLYGRVTTYDGATYEGRLRWGGDEEAFWGNYFNGFKDENPWVALAPLDRLTEERRPIEIFGFEIPLGERQIDLGRPFMARFGDIARIEARGNGVRATFESGIEFDSDVRMTLERGIEFDPGVRGTLESRIEFDPDVRVTLKSGTVFDLDRLSAGDFDDGVRVWDGRRGVVDLGPRQIRTIELLPTARLGDVPDRLHGTVRTRHGDFTGFLQWDRQEAVGRDELLGRTADGELGLRFDTIRSITRYARNSSLVTLLDGREVVLSDSRKVGPGNRGIYVDDQRYGRVLVSWDAFEHVDFSPGGSGPSYGDFSPGRPLTGIVTTRAGRRHAGRLVYDLDESEITETLDAPSQGVDYTIPFGLVASIVLPGREERAAGRAKVTLHSGEELELERTGDLDDANAGMMIFAAGRERPEYVPWVDVEQIDFDRSSAMYPPVGGR
jgi:hypothetical protein